MYVIYLREGLIQPHVVDHMESKHQRVYERHAGCGCERADCADDSATNKRHQAWVNEALQNNHGEGDEAHVERTNYEPH